MVSWVPPSSKTMLSNYVDMSTPIFESNQQNTYPSNNSYYRVSHSSSHTKHQHHHNHHQRPPQHPNYHHSSKNSRSTSTQQNDLNKPSSSSNSSVKKTFPCPFPGCNQTSSNKGNLSKHIATKHEHRKDFVCPFFQCNRRFAKKYNMLRHLSASGVHRSTKIPPSNDSITTPPSGNASSSKQGRRSSDRAKWSSMELDLASFLAKQCQ